MVVPVPDAAKKLAQPMAAPPSSTQEPPLQSSGGRPRISTSRALGGAETTPVSGDRCRVGFWNLTGRDIVVNVAGKSWTLTKNQTATFDLGREFSWQIAGRAQHLERVPDGQATYEVVVRE
jgi:hypothetical protein